MIYMSASYTEIYASSQFFFFFWVTIIPCEALIVITIYYLQPTPKSYKVETLLKIRPILYNWPDWVGVLLYNRPKRDENTPDCQHAPNYHCQISDFNLSERVFWIKFISEKINHALFRKLNASKFYLYKWHSFMLNVSNIICHTNFFKQIIKREMDRCGSSVHDRLNGRWRLPSKMWQEVGWYLLLNYTSTDLFFSYILHWSSSLIRIDWRVDKKKCSTLYTYRLSQKRDCERFLILTDSSRTGSKIPHLDHYFYNKK